MTTMPPKTEKKPPAPLFSSLCRWIGCDAADRPYNNFACFRRTFEVDAAACASKATTPPAAATLRLTADSRYEVFLNGEWLGHGPARSWPAPWPVDEYDVSSLLRPGTNVLAVLTHHIGLGTFQYLHAEAGLLAELEWTEGKRRQRLSTDATWRTLPHQGFGWPVPRIAVQQAWEEQYDARQEPTDAQGRDWRAVAFDDSAWPVASVLRKPGTPPHETFETRDIPFLTRTPVAPVRVSAVALVRPASYTWSLQCRDLINPTDKNASFFLCRHLLATHIWSDHAQSIQVHQPHAMWGYGATPCKLNGAELAFEETGLQNTDIGVATGRLAKGWNLLLVLPPRQSHHSHTVLNFWTDKAVRFAARPETKSDSPWLFLGPFQTPDEEAAGVKWTPVILPEHIEAEATQERYEAIWERGTLTEEDLNAPFARPLPSDTVAQADVYAICASERVAPQAPLTEGLDALRHDTADWATLHPGPGGLDVRLTIDYGDEVVGFQEFEVDAPAGTILDFHNFEFVQRNGRVNLAEGMNNSFRYVCREGRQRYRTFVRRGFRYTDLTVRGGFKRPVRLRGVRTLMSVYPSNRLGDFACSDPMLERIWHVGAHTVQCCSEDTYTDCPTYEQTHWVGDARNEALVDLIVNGDPALSRHCWIQAARSLERSPLVECHVPSSWRVILPAWTFLWMRWAEEHFMLTGDKTFAREAIPWLDRNVRGIREHVGEDGLFRINAWNMFDWAPMDAPNDASAITHLNCLACLGLRQAARLAERTGHPAKARDWMALFDRLATAVNKHLWSEEKKAYYDRRAPDGTPSTVFSQQTHAAALISHVAQGQRSARCRDIVLDPPEGFVTSGTPFFMFFVLEALAGYRLHDAMIDTIRDYWGRQIEAGATTIWEMMHTDAERQTRSHCHGWSAAPTYFLTTEILGVKPLKPGFKEVRLAPHPGKLAWACGNVPTASGPIRIRWKSEPDEFWLQAVLPEGVVAEIELPFEGRTIDRRMNLVKQVMLGDNVFRTKGPIVNVRVLRD